MSRKTKTRRPGSTHAPLPARYSTLGDVPGVAKPLKLLCRSCGAFGKYDVGTVVVNRTAIGAPKAADARDCIGFTGYFRCRKCDAGGPWDYPTETWIYLTAKLILASCGDEDVPLIFGQLATFDGHPFSLATDAESHLKTLIEREPSRAFLWVRLGNIYGEVDRHEPAKKAYERAIELDPKDIEAHTMLGQILMDKGRPLDAVPHWHAVLKHARDARQVKKQLRSELVRAAIEKLLQAHAESHGQIDLLPEMDPEEVQKRSDDETVILECREFDLSSEEGMDDLCSTFLDKPSRRRRGLFDWVKRHVAKQSDRGFGAPIRQNVLTVGRNAPCPCGSGRKYKKCCGR